MLKVKHNFSTTYHHHEILGTVERNHRTFNEYLRAFLKDDRHLWDRYSKWFCYNTTPNSAFNYYTPFELVYGRRPRTYEDIYNNSPGPVYTVDSYGRELQYSLNLVHNRVKLFIDRNKSSIKAHYDKRSRVVTFRLGDKVLLRDEARHKLDPIFREDFEIGAIEGVDVILKNLNTQKTSTVHKNRLVLA